MDDFELDLPQTQPQLARPEAQRPPRVAVDHIVRVLVLRDRLAEDDVAMISELYEPDVVLCARPAYAHMAQRGHALAVLPSSSSVRQQAGGLTVAGVATIPGTKTYAPEDLSAAPVAVDIVFAPNDVDPLASRPMRRYLEGSAPLLCVHGADKTGVHAFQLGGEIVNHLAVASWAVVDLDGDMRRCDLLGSA